LTQEAARLVLRRLDEAEEWPETQVIPLDLWGRIRRAVAPEAAE
jgi:hypothetical protein